MDGPSEQHDDSGAARRLGGGDSRDQLERQLAVARRLRAATDVAARLLRFDSLDDVAGEATSALTDQFDVDAAEVWVRAGDAELRLAARAGDGRGSGSVPGEVVAVAAGASIVADVARTRMPVVLNDTWEGSPSAAVYPILLGDDLEAVLAAYRADPFPVDLADVLAAFTSVVSASFTSAALLARERRARAEAEERQDRLALLAEASDLLARTLDVGDTLRNVARLAVRSLADWCAVAVVEDDGSIRRVAVTAADPAKEELTAILSERFPFDPHAATGVVNVIRTGHAELYPEVPDALLEATSMGDEYLDVVRRLGFRSAMIVPLAARGQVLGAVTFVAADEGRRYTRDDLALAEELARRAALALDNARLHRQVQQGEARFRRFVDSLGAIIWEADAETGRFSFVSQRAEDLLGHPRAAWVDDDRFWIEHLHPDDREAVVAARAGAVASGLPYDVEYRMRAADGTQRWFRDIVFVAPDDDGRPHRLLGVMVDVTADKEAEAELRESRERFASLAATLQASLLPPVLPEMFGLEVGARYVAGGAGVDVVGDFYDLFEVGEDGWGVVIGDVCGKGAEAAALTALTRYTVRAAAMRERVPSRVLHTLNEAVLHADVGDRFCTAAYCLVLPDGQGVSCTLASGGHPLPLVLREHGGVERLGEPGTLLGCFPEVELADTWSALRPGDSIVFFTDGALESRRGDDDFGDERLVALVSTCAGLHADDVADAVVEAVSAFRDDRPQDDLAVLVLRVPG